MYVLLGKQALYMYHKLEIFFVHSRQLQNLKCMFTISVHAVQGIPIRIFQHENLSYKNFITHKFPDLM